MTAFARAVAALHRDVNLSVACEWFHGWSRGTPRTLLADLQVETYSLSADGLAIRGTRSQESGSTYGAGPRGAVADQQLIDIAIADVPAGLLHGDLLVIDGTTFTVEEPNRDAEAVTWRITLSAAA